LKKEGAGGEIFTAFPRRYNDDQLTAKNKKGVKNES